MFKKMFFILLIGLLSSGCSLRQAGYTVGGAGAGGAIGYYIHRDKKEAAIGALGGALVGNIAGQIQDSSDKKKNKTQYDKGYAQAQVDMANQNWQAGTGQYARNNSDLSKRLTRYKVPKRQENGVVYDEHFITLEEYQ
ncbi:MAG: glycine zipper 2TM domain-containing protein [Candidatus Omnitrophica bacterium]|nr:glycine zipper 2TM domain-containing protein [Candidatus Omnitrophota bacterium]